VIWQRPFGLFALLLPLALLLLSLRRSRPRAVPLGTFALWTEEHPTRRGARARWRVPLARAATIAALVALALALADPAAPRPAGRATWRVVVDPRPALYLEHTDEAGRPSGRGRRLDVALERLEREASRAGVALEFWRPGEGGLEPGGASLPAAWRSAPELLGPPEDPARHDREGTLWLSAAAPNALERAGFVASGGGPVPGAVAEDARGIWTWDGRALVLGPAPSERRAVALRGELPPLVEELVDLWCEERGLARLRAPDESTHLVVHGDPVAQGVPVDLARDGWSARARAGRAEPGETWLDARVDGRRVPVVTRAAGSVHVALAELDEPRGEPGAFAVSWAELFDGALLPRPGVVPCSERLAAGPTRFEPPRPGREAPDPGPDWPWSARLALFGALALLAALLLGEGRGAGGP